MSGHFLNKSRLIFSVRGLQSLKVFLTCFFWCVFVCHSGLDPLTDSCLLVFLMRSCCLLGLPGDRLLHWIFSTFKFLALTIFFNMKGHFNGIPVGALFIILYWEKTANHFVVRAEAECFTAGREPRDFCLHDTLSTNLVCIAMSGTFEFFPHIFTLVN